MELDPPHGVQDVGISAEMNARFHALVQQEWNAAGLWDSDFRSQLARPLSASTYIDASLRVRGSRAWFSSVVPLLSHACTGSCEQWAWRQGFPKLVRAASSATAWTHTQRRP